MALFLFSLTLRADNFKAVVLVTPPESRLNHRVTAKPLMARQAVYESSSKSGVYIAHRSALRIRPKIRRDPKQGDPVLAELFVGSTLGY